MTVLDQGVQELANRFNSIVVKHEEDALLNDNPEAFIRKQSILGNFHSEFYPAGYELVKLAIAFDRKEDFEHNMVECLKLLAESEEAYTALPDDYQRALHKARIICHVLFEKHGEAVVDALEGIPKDNFFNDVSCIVNFDHGVVFTKTQSLPVSNNAIDYLRNHHTI